MSPFRSCFALCCSLTVVVACGGKIAGDTGEQGPGGGGSGDPAPESPLPPDDTSDPPSEPDPSRPPPDDVDEPPVRDPFELAFDRCGELCALPEVQCQESLGSSVAGCTEDCATTGSNMDLPECRDMFFALLDCVQDAALEAGCRDDFQGELADRCMDLVAAHANECLDGTAPPLPPPDPGLVECGSGVGTTSDTFCSSLFEDCSDGRVYEVSCRQLSSFTIECDCSIDGQTDAGFAFDGAGADALEGLCHSPEGFEACGFPVVW